MLTNRKKLLVAGAGSLLLHAVALLGAAVVIALQPPAAPPPKPLHLEIVKSEPAVSALAAPTPEHRVVDTEDMRQAEHPAADALFQGDKDTAAASEGPASGDKPLPTQQGRVAPSYAFNTTVPAPAASPPAAESAAPPPTSPPPPAPSRSLVRDLSADAMPTLVHNDLSMLDSAPAVTPPEEVNPYDPSFRSTAPEPPTPARRPTSASAYHPLEEQTASSGNITTRGASSVAALATPFGRYQKAVLNSIRGVWTEEVAARSDMASLGAIKVHFAIDRSGHVHTPRVLSNSSNSALESITLDAIMRAAIPPIPPEVSESMTGAMLPLDVTFECL